MTRLLRDSESILEVAVRGGGEDCEIAILVDDGGAIRMVPAGGWAVEALRLHYGARAAYGVRRRGGRVELEARSAGEVCRLERNLRSSPRARVGGGPVAAVAAAAAWRPDRVPAGLPCGSAIGPAADSNFRAAGRYVGNGEETIPTRDLTR